MKTIGVFDSGVGGLSVVNAIKKALPDNPVIYVDDKENIPYGDKRPKQLLMLVIPILNKLSKECDVIVIACNTVSTTIIDELRDIIKVPLIAIEPMVKPASEITKSGVIAVCATPATLASKRYKWLKSTYALHVEVLEPSCSDWASMIEDNNVDENIIRDRMMKVLDKGADVIVLGCTHYNWIEELIIKIAEGRAQVIQPEKPVIDQLKRVFGQIA